jgi:alkylation response protein AidB-like acyl-CoA dehydrogenase
MDFAFTKEQTLIRNSASEFFKKESPPDRVRAMKHDPKGYDPKLWKKIAELGFTGMNIPETHGGSGGSFLDLMVIMEEIGRYLVPGPFFSTVALCAMPLLEFGNRDQKEQFLPQIAEKNRIWSFALLEDSANYEPSDVNLKVEMKGEQFILTGKKLFVPFADTADWFLVFGRTEPVNTDENGITAFIVDAKSAGITVEVMPTIARDKKCEVIFHDVAVPGKNILGSMGRGWEIVEFVLEKASVLKSAEMLGGAQAVFEMALTYVKGRVQFGKTIGSFQAVQHRLVDMSMELDSLRFLVYEAAWKIADHIGCRQLCSMVKAKANEVYHRVCVDGTYLHGASGFTEEMDVGLFYIRSKAHEFDLGGTAFHRDRIAEELEKHEPAYLSL